MGWCTLLAIDASLFTGWLKAEVGKSMFGQPPELRAAASFRPIGEARIVDGGYRVTGRWDYASGVDNANWLAANCKVVDANGPRLTPAGTPETRMVSLRTRPRVYLDLGSNQHWAGHRTRGLGHGGKSLGGNGSFSPGGGSPRDPSYLPRSTGHRQETSYA